jgi:hypothetical protein
MFHAYRKRGGGSRNPPTGRLGMFHPSLQEIARSGRRRPNLKDPQPAGWGITGGPGPSARVG